jgi:16S rRNA (adenine1518-N6/adenine1519-N6)-dimethyltransferase
MIVTPKKNLGQHFLTNKEVSLNIVNSLCSDTSIHIIEVGPGIGALTQFLIKKTNPLTLIEIDEESVMFLKDKFPQTKIIHTDFLKLEFDTLQLNKCSIIGNFPYNISSQILFKIIENRHIMVETIGMFQKEVAERICSKPKSKKYGILSVLTQAYFKCEYLFEVSPNDFHPRPKVDSAVIKLTRNKTIELSCSHKHFSQVVKAGFNQRRKKLKNALKKFSNLEDSGLSLTLSKRAEELSVNDFIMLTNQIFSNS